MPLSLLHRGSPCLNLERENPLLDCPLPTQAIRRADIEKQINRESTPIAKYSVENPETAVSVAFMRSVSEIFSYLERIKLLLYLEFNPTFSDNDCDSEIYEAGKPNSFTKEVMSSENRGPVNPQNLSVLSIYRTLSQSLISF